MPKMKTHGGSKKRFRVTGSGHVKYKHAGMRHILTKMTTKRKRNLRKAGIIKKADMYRVKRLLVLA